MAKNSKPKTGSISVDMNSKEEYMRDKDGIYNHADNLIYIKSSGDKIYVVCNTEDQTDKVVQKLTTDTCKMVSYEEWDEGEDKKYILQFLVVDDMYEITPELN